METFQLRRTDYDPLVFTGTLLAKVTSPKCETDDGHRGYELGLYENSEGGFVVSIEYLSTCPNERSVAQADIVDQPHDVESAFLVFQPCEHVDCKALRTHADVQGRRLRKVLYRIYDEQVSEILDTLTMHCGDWQDEPLSDEPERAFAPMRGILAFLRIK